MVCSERVCQNANKINKKGDMERMNFIILVRGVNSEEAEWTGQGGVAGDQNGKPSIQFNVPMYVDLEKLAVQDFTGYNASAHPAYGQKAYMPFSTALAGVTTAKDYMLGIVEVMLAK